MEQGGATRKYLDRYAEPEAGLASEVPGDFAEVLVIPSYGEGSETVRALASVPGSRKGDVLVIVVLNARLDSPKWVHDANAHTRDAFIRSTGEGLTLSDGTPLLPHVTGRLLLIDRARDGRFLPERQGVGLARKIGADVAAALIARSRVDSPWIHCTDADVRLPADYFEKIESVGFEGAAALLHPFRHRADPETAIGRAVLEYEVSLRYFVLGLCYAGSRYAHHSIGSTISVQARAYAKVRGFPRRRAAEDFYLLNKLAKVGTIASLNGTPIELSGRESERVPFGTGRAVHDALARNAGRAVHDAPARNARPAGLDATTRGEDESLELYDPAVFAALRAWVRTLDAFALGESGSEPRALLARIANSSDAKFDAAALEACLDDMDAFPALKHASAHRRAARDLRRHLHDHFDAFRCLKLAHALRDRAHPSLALRTALARAPFVDAEVDAPLPLLCEQLAALERRQAATP